MLIRIGGGNTGIKEYLETGHKQGREHSRDQLDERLVLAGDLDFTDQIIAGMEVEDDGERYLHITLSFKEDDIPEQTMREIVEEFRRFAFAAYKAEEYTFYAEAHIPRVKSYENQRTGELVERKPHIHFIVPKQNLLSGGTLNPFGLVKLSERHLDAFQEHINNKYGLASPKDNLRVEFTDSSDMIQRYKGDYFDGGNKVLKREILAAVLDREITVYEDFARLVGEFGATRVRNAGRDNAYLNVKPEGNAKGVNLNDYVFTRQFIELPAAGKIKALSATMERKYEVQGETRRNPATLEATLADWCRFRSKEIKYINSGNRKLYQAYRAARPEERDRILAEREARFYEKYQEPQHEPERFTGKNPLDHDYPFKRPVRDRVNDRNGQPERPNGPPGREQRGAGRLGGTVGERGAGGPGAGAGSGTGRFAHHPDRQHDAGQAGTFEQTRTINRLRSVPGGDVVRPRHQGNVLLPDHAPDQLGNRRAQSNHRVRRPRDRQSVNATGRVSDSLVSQIARDFAQRQQSGAAGRLPEFQEIKLKLDAKRLLAELSRSHGVIMEKYPVTTAPDGSARIRCGTRNLNVSDFLTREMRLPWNEAARILRHSYGRQLERHPGAAPRTAPDRLLWRQFQDQRRERGGLRAQLAAQLESERTRREALQTRLDDARRAASGLPAAQRKAALSVARMEHMTAATNLKTAFLAERAPFRLPVAEQYRHFLQERAQAGDAVALTELRRRTRTEPMRHDEALGHIHAAGGAGQRQEPNTLFYRGRQVRHRVYQNGDVVYSLAGRPALQDKGDSIMLLRTDRVAIEAALRLGQEKFGNSLSLSGSTEFQERAARIAAEIGLEVRFDNKHTEQIRQQRASELAGRRGRPTAQPSTGSPKPPLPGPSREPDIDRE
jgi:hypothetical protein